MTGEMIERLKKQSEFGKPVADGKGRDETMLEAAATIEAQAARIAELEDEAREADEALTSERSEYLKLRLKVMAADNLASEVREVSQRFYKGDATRDEIESALAAYLSTPSPTDPVRDAAGELLEALKGIRIYADDTLYGRTDGPDDREWQRSAVIELRDRARAAIRRAEGGQG